MKPTFKIGDVIDTDWGTRRKIVDIVLEARTVDLKWVGGNGKVMCLNKYVLCDMEKGTLTIVRIDHQDGFTLVSSEQKNTVSSCPNCGKEKWRIVYSDWAKESIKKCSNCGWC